MPYAARSGGFVHQRLAGVYPALSVALCLGFPLSAAAQAQPAPTARPDDAPAIRVGVTIFADYTVTQEPKGTDADGNEITPNAFNIQRAYLNVTGQINRLVHFRVTPDIARETGSGSSLNGSYTFRLKYAYAQFNLDQWMTRGTWARLGMQQTPWVDYIDNVYRYRFQGPTFEDREGILSSSDVGASFHYNFAGNYGDLHAGIYNGDNYNRPEANDQKALMIRGTVRPLPAHPWLRGLRVTGFYNLDAYLKDGERRRGIVGATFEHRYLNTGGNYLTTLDQPRASAAEVEGRGYSLWITPKTTAGWEGLLRYDHLEPDADAPAERSRLIAGVAYWFTTQGSVTAAIMFDIEDVNNERFAPPRPDERRYAVHMLVNF
jgi:hypothetical protein